MASGTTGPATLQLVTGGAIAIEHALAVAGSLSLTAGSTVSAAGAVNVGATFRLASGTWTQNTTGLPAFSAGNFIIAPGASFLRATNGDGSAGAPYVIADVYGLQGIASLDLRHCAPADYPAAAKAQGAQGTTQLALLIGTDGVVQASRLERSSGHPQLDEAARAALGACRFAPALQDGVPLQQWARTRYAWQLAPGS